MKKVIIAFDGTHFSEGACRFALQLHKLKPLMISGIFIPQLSYSSLWSYSGGGFVPDMIPYCEEDDSKVVHENIDRFQRFCLKNGISYSIHKDFFDFALPELKKETRFADLLILSSETFYNHVYGEQATDYIKEVLHISECPVIAVPEEYHFPEKVLMAYDGSESSVYAIRQFIYLMPELCNLETLIFCMKPDPEFPFPDESHIKEFAEQHFKNCKFVKLNFANKRQLSLWLEEQKAVLVSGSLGRNFISQLFRDTFVSRVIEERKCLVFVAHK